MASQVQGVRLGTPNAYLVGVADAYALVDAGLPGRQRKLLTFLQSRSVAPAEIKLIVVTHVHYDHVGSLAAIREACQCPVMVHRLEAGLLERGEVVIPPGVTVMGRVASCLGRQAKALLGFAPVRPDVVIEEATSLAQWGVAARVVPTPGHTAGSLSVLVPGGEACVGDLMTSFFPFAGHAVSPPFAEDLPALYRSWEALVKAGVHTFYPGHGRPIGGATVQRRLEGTAARRRAAATEPAGEEAC